MAVPVDSTIVIQLVYCSTATKPFSSGELAGLVAHARQCNAAAGITGDYRHHHIQLLLIQENVERNFPADNMAFLDASGRTASLPGYCRAAGFADLLGDPAQIVRAVSDFRDGRWRSIDG